MSFGENSLNCQYAQCAKRCGVEAKEKRPHSTKCVDIRRVTCCNSVMKKKSPKDCLAQAIKDAGGAAAIAKQFKFPYTSTVYNWQSREIPVKWAVKLCKIKGVTVTPNQLRPDVF